MNSVLLNKGIIHTSGEINKDKINLVAGGNHTAICRNGLGNDGRRYGNNKPSNRHARNHEHPRRPGQTFQNHKIALWAYGLTVFRGKPNLWTQTPPFWITFFFPFTADFGEIIKDYIAET